MGWTHRERVLAALDREEADRVAIDFGATSATTATLPAYERLKDYLGLSHEAAAMSEISQTACLDESVLKRFAVDTRYVGFGLEPERVGETVCRDEWGVVWKRAPDHPYMPAGGPFYGERPDVAALAGLAVPDPDDPACFDGLRERAAALRATGCAVFLNTPTGCTSQSQLIRGFGNWLKDLYKNREVVCRMLDIATEWWIRRVVNALEAAGGNVDVVQYGDDLSSQQGPLFSPEIYREIIKPRHRRVIAAVKTAAEVKFLFHSCGAVHEFIEDLIEIGVDAVNPVQVNAAGMDPVNLKAEFGDRIAFWGGVDTQHVLPSGSASEVAAETRRMVSVLGEGGGYVLGSVHNIQAEVPPENVVAMFDTALAHSYRRAA